MVTCLRALLFSIKKRSVSTKIRIVRKEMILALLFITCCLSASIEIALQNISFMSSVQQSEVKWKKIVIINEFVTKLNVLNLKENDVLI